MTRIRAGRQSQWMLGLLAAIAMTLIAPLNASADKGFDVTVDNGGYRFTIRCNYEPQMRGKVIEVVVSDSSAMSDTLVVPREVTAYGDTFPVRVFDGYMPSDVAPSVVDYAGCNLIWTVPSSVKEVIFGATVDTLGCWFGKTGIEHIDLSNVRNLKAPRLWHSNDRGVFEDCWSLTSVTLSPELTTIPALTFSGTGLKAIDFPGVKYVGEQAFGHCSSLESAVLVSVDTVESEAFAYCKNLTSANIGDGVKHVAENAFNNTSLTYLNLHNAISYAPIAFMPNELEGIRPQKAVVMSDMPALQLLKSSHSAHYIGFYNRGMTLDAPELRAIRADNVTGVCLTGKHLLRQAYLTNCRIDSLDINRWLINGYIKDTSVEDNRNSYFDPWYCLKLDGSAIDNLTLADGNPSFFVEDSLLLTSAIKREYIPSNWFWGDSIFVTIDNEWVSKWKTKPTNDTIALASVGFPRGEWFVPRNNRFNGVAYCCDYVDKIRLNPDFAMTGYTLRTYNRPASSPHVKVYVAVDLSRADEVLACCVSEDMDFIVPEGMLGRYIAAGFPPERTFEDTEGVLAIDLIEADEAPALRKGTFTIDGRRLPDGAVLAPGVYIIDGRKHYVR